MTSAGSRALRRASPCRLSAGVVLATVLACCCTPAAWAVALRVRPFTPLRAALVEIARRERVPLEQVLAEPERWLRREPDANERPRTRLAPPDPLAVTEPGIRFGVPATLDRQLARPIAGDFDGDGFDDVCATRTTDGAVLLLRGDAVQPLAVRASFEPDPGDVAAASADVDADGRADLVAVRESDHSVAVYRSLGGFAWATPLRIPMGFAPAFVAAGDVTGDGRTDLVVASGDRVSALVNAGGGTFAPGAAFVGLPVSDTPAIADLDGDGRGDVVLRDAGGDHVVLHLLRSAPGDVFAPWPDVVGAAGNYYGTGGFAAGDVSGDSLPELLAFDLDTLRVWSTSGAGAFVPAQKFALSAWSPDGSIEVADVDRDGRADVAVALRAGRCIDPCPRLALLSGGGGGLAPPVHFLFDEPNPIFGTAPDATASGDFDGDHAPDLVVTTPASGSRLTLVLNDRLGGFSAPASVDLADDLVPVDVEVARVAPATHRLFVWDGLRTWTSTDLAAHGARVRGPFADGELVAVRDLDGDGLDEIVLAAGDSTRVFAAAEPGGAPRAVYTGGSFVALADADGADGPDLFVADAAGGVHVRANDGTGAFGAAVPCGVTLASDVTCVAGADLDRDGFAELLVAHDDGAPHDTLDVHWNVAGAFGPAAPHAIGLGDDPPIPASQWTFPASIVTGDFDGNGWPDVAVVGGHVAGWGSLSALIHAGPRTFLPAAAQLAGRGPWEAVAADFDQDGLDDVAVVLDFDIGDGLVLVLQASWGGVLQPLHRTEYGATLPAEHYPTCIARGDWDGDGRADLVVGNRFSRSLTFYRNTSPPQQPTAAGVALVSVEATGGAVRLVWFAPHVGFAAALERATPAGAWEPVATLAADGEGRLEYRDDAIVPGTRAGYRLRWVEQGAVRRSPDVWVQIPLEAPAALALAGARPNPARGTPVLALDVPAAAEVRIELFDIGGRRVADVRLASPAPGRHAIPVRGARPLAPGVYLARATQSGRSATARIVVAD